MRNEEYQMVMNKANGGERENSGQMDGGFPPTQESSKRWGGILASMIAVSVLSKL